MVETWWKHDVFNLSLTMNDGNSGPVDYGDMIDDQWWSMMEKVRPPFLNLKNMKMVATSNFWGRSSSRGMPLVDGHLFKKIKTCLVCSKKILPGEVSYLFSHLPYETWLYVAVGIGRFRQIFVFAAMSEILSIGCNASLAQMSSLRSLPTACTTASKRSCQPLEVNG